MGADRDRPLPKLEVARLAHEAEAFVDAPQKVVLPLDYDGVEVEASEAVFDDRTVSWFPRPSSS